MKIVNNYNEWLTHVTTKKFRTSQLQSRDLQKQAIGNNRQDLTRPILEDLQTQGYDTVTWDASQSRHSICRELHNQKWPLKDFLVGLTHDAPLFERSHPGDVNCLLILTGPDNPTIAVDSFGSIQEL
jgi:hypothetical protein